MIAMTRKECKEILDDIPDVLIRSFLQPLLNSDPNSHNLIISFFFVLKQLGLKIKSDEEIINKIDIN